MKSFNELLSETRDLYAGLNNPRKALKNAQRLVDMAPENYEALNLLGAILYELDMEEEAYVYYKKALEFEKNSIEAMEGLISIANDSEDYESAIKLANQAIKLEDKDPYPEFKENPEYHQRLMAQIYIEKAYSLYKMGEISKSKEVILKTAKEACPLEKELFDEEWEILLEEE